MVMCIYPRFVKNCYKKIAIQILTYAIISQEYNLFINKPWILHCKTHGVIDEGVVFLNYNCVYQNLEFSSTRCFKNYFLTSDLTENDSITNSEILVLKIFERTNMGSSAYNHSVAVNFRWGNWVSQSDCTQWTPYS